MSVDVITKQVEAYPLGKSAASIVGQSSGLITDIVVLYGGWGGVNQGGQTLPAGPSTGSSQLVDEIEKISQTPPVLHAVKITSLTGDMGGSSVNQGLNFIKSNFHPLGRVVIYGYSMGGVNALDLSWKIDRELPHFHFPSNSLVPTQVPVPVGAPGTPPSLGRVRIDLLVTVDAAYGPASKVIGRTVPSCVRRNLNFYESNPKPKVYSQGGPNVAENPAATDIENVDLSKKTSLRFAPQVVDHATIDNDTWYEVIAAIRGTLGCTVRPSFSYPDGMLPV